MATTTTIGPRGDDNDGVELTSDDEQHAYMMSDDRQHTYNVNRTVVARTEIESPPQTKIDLSYFRGRI
jgi:hypothetical protein